MIPPSKNKTTTVSSMVKEESGKKKTTRSAFSSWSYFKNSSKKKQFVRGQPDNDPGRTTHRDKPGVTQCGHFHKHNQIEKNRQSGTDTGCDAEARLLFGLRGRNSNSNPAKLTFKITVKTPLTERKREHNKEASLKAR